MIGSLRGKILEVGATFSLLEIAGIGYRVMSPPSVLNTLKAGNDIFLYIHDHVREDAHDLYGFLTGADLQLFERLLTISGVGPKVGMTILSLGSAELVRHAIMNGDITTLTSVPGVGKKTAQKIMLELKGQLVELGQEAPADREVIEALQSLGYTLSQAREAMKAITSESASTSDRVREALRFLAR